MNVSVFFVIFNDLIDFCSVSWELLYFTYGPLFSGHGVYSVEYVVHPPFLLLRTRTRELSGLGALEIGIYYGVYD